MHARMHCTPPPRDREWEGEKATAVARLPRQVSAPLSRRLDTRPGVQLTADLTAGISPRGRGRGGAVAVPADSAPGRSEPYPYPPPRGDYALCLPRWARGRKCPLPRDACRGPARSGPRNLTAGRTDVSSCGCGCGGAVSLSVWVRGSPV